MPRPGPGSESVKQAVSKCPGCGQPIEAFGSNHDSSSKAAPERHASCLLHYVQKADVSSAQSRAAARPWVVLLLAHPGKEIILGDAYDAALHHIFHKTWPRLKFRQKCKRTTPQEHPKLMEAALAALKGPKSGLTAEAWLEAGLVEATAAYMEAAFQVLSEPSPTLREMQRLEFVHLMCFALESLAEALPANVVGQRLVECSALRHWWRACPGVTVTQLRDQRLVVGPVAGLIANASPREWRLQQALELGPVAFRTVLANVKPSDGLLHLGHLLEMVEGLQMVQQQQQQALAARAEQEAREERARQREALAKGSKKRKASGSAELDWLSEPEVPPLQVPQPVALGLRPAAAGLADTEAAAGQGAATAEAAGAAGTEAEASSPESEAVEAVAATPTAGSTAAEAAEAAGPSQASAGPAAQVPASPPRPPIAAAQHPCPPAPSSPRSPPAAPSPASPQSSPSAQSAQSPTATEAEATAPAAPAEGVAQAPAVPADAAVQAAAQAQAAQAAAAAAPAPAAVQTSRTISDITLRPGADGGTHLTINLGPNFMDTHPDAGAPAMCAALLLSSGRVRAILVELLQRGDCRDAAVNKALACVHICLQLVGVWRAEAAASLCDEGVGQLLLKSVVKQCYEQMEEVLAAPGGEQGLQRLLEVVILLADQPTVQHELTGDRQLTQLLKAAVSMGGQRPMLRSRVLQAARDLLLAMGCIENQRSSPAPPPDDPSDKPMGEMLLNAGAGSGDGMCAQVSSVPGLQMLLLTQVRVLQRRHPQHLEQLFCQSYLEHSLQDPRHQLQAGWQRLEQLRSQQGSQQQQDQQQAQQQPRAMGTRPQPGPPPAWAEGLGYSALVLLQAGFMAQVKLGELRWGDLAQLSSSLPICSEQQGAAGEVHTARLCSVHARIMAILAGMPGVHNNKRNLAWKEEPALIELAQRPVELYVRDLTTMLSNMIASRPWERQHEQSACALLRHFDMLLRQLLRFLHRMLRVEDCRHRQTCLREYCNGQQMQDLLGALITGLPPGPPVLLPRATRRAEKLVYSLDKPKPPVRVCGACGSEAQPMHVCGACKTTRYCSMRCQRSHWQQHKEEGCPGRGGHCKQAQGQQAQQGVLQPQLTADELQLQDQH